MMMGILVAKGRESRDREREREENGNGIYSCFFSSFFSQCKNDGEP